MQKVLFLEPSWYKELHQETMGTYNFFIYKQRAWSTDPLTSNMKEAIILVDLQIGQVSFSFSANLILAPAPHI